MNKSALLLQTDLGVQRCETHKVTIYFFKRGKMEHETACWDCWRDVNKKKRPRNITLEECIITKPDLMLPPPTGKK